MSHQLQLLGAGRWDCHLEDSFFYFVIIIIVSFLSAVIEPRALLTLSKYSTLSYNSSQRVSGYCGKTSNMT